MLGKNYLFIGSVAGLFLTSFLSTSVSYPEPASSIITGKALYRLNCARCHQADRSGYAPSYPPLINIKEKFSKESIMGRMEKGKGRMPAFPYLSMAEKETIVSFLFEKEGVDDALSPDDRANMIIKSQRLCRHAVHNPHPPVLCRRRMAHMDAGVRCFAAGDHCLGPVCAK